MNTKTKTLWQSFPVVLATAFFCCTLWGSASPSIKIAYRIFEIEASDIASRLTLAGARFFLSGVMVLIAGSLISGHLLVPKKQVLGKIAVLSLFQTILQYFFFFMSLAYISAVRGSIINALGYFFSILFSALLFRFEKLNFRKVAGCLIGFLGVLIIVTRGQSLSGGISLRGEGAMILSTIFSSVAACLIKLYSKEEDPVTLSGCQFLFGGAVLFLTGRILGGSLQFRSIQCVLLLLYLGFLSAGAYTFWGILLKYNPVSRVSVFGFINPVMGVILSALMLGERNDAFSLAGLTALALVSLGIIIVNRDSSTRTGRPQANRGN